MGDDPDRKRAEAGKRTAKVMVATGLFWIVTTYLGSHLGWPQRTRALFDLIALAGFGWALWMTYGIWRSRQNDKG
ncbi:DUF5337 domain-containing protein [Marivivens marinus]|uniref:DUF5337 domain-containing protein n=1 Tax=Marivivens marinus TaxID=3110173 RepID=UPI003B84B66B